jgi:DNA-directed RNA polymerase specialized sigma24 family protein
VTETTCSESTTCSERLICPRSESEFDLVDARLDLAELLPRLGERQRRTLVKWSQGQTYAQLAAGEKISDVAVHYRIRGGLQKLRDLARA